jgi:energy-coupling factor transporter ATP-binding protein EcfA2
MGQFRLPNEGMAQPLPPLPPPFRRSIAVVIGINAYAHGIPRLQTAVNDARRLAYILATQHGYENITLLDGEATHQRLETLLTEELPARVSSDDRVCFYFAGHGVALDGDQGPNGYLLPQDARRGDKATYLPMPRVHDALLKLACRHMLVILDSCFSGAFRWSSIREITALPEVIHQQQYDRFVRDPAWQVITSASQDQTALDQLSTGSLGSRDHEGAHSPFALALFRGLEGEGDVVPRAGGDGVITATELYLFIEEQLQTATIEAGARQTPRLWPLRKHEKGEFIFLAPGRDVSLPPAPPLTFDNNPWRGLVAYDRADTDLFFGRDAAISALQQAIEQRPFVAVLGSSGTGKSSLVRAGVLPRLKPDAGWLVLPVVRPGTSPMEALARSVETMRPGVHVSDPAGIEFVVAAWCRAHPRHRLLLVVDQCEELVSMAHAATARDAVMQLLGRLLEAHPGQARVMLTLRTDYEPQFDRSALAPRWHNARFVVPPMSRAELKAVIEQPASKRVLYFDPPALVETLVDDVVNTPGGLPLLSFALSELYVRYVTRQSADRALTHADYADLGGVVGALRSSADAVYEALDKAHQASMQRLMLRMVAGGTGSLVKRRVSDAELDFPDAAESARVHKVLQCLTGARLVVEGKESDGESYAEPAHDALVRAWGRLLGWLHEASADAVPLVTRQKLATAALEWARAGDGAARRGLLWSDRVRSAMLAPIVSARVPWLNTHELAFAQRSVRGWRNTLWAGGAVMLVIAVLSVVSAIFGLSARSNAEEALKQKDDAIRNRKKAEDQTNQAKLKGQEAVAAAKRAEAEKVRTVKSLFSSLKLYMGNANTGSVCVRRECGAEQSGDGSDWISISQVPNDVRSIDGKEASHDFIVAREYDKGHVLVYAHDGLTSDGQPSEGQMSGKRSDNLVFAENALRWLAPAHASPECARGTKTKILFWEGTYLGIEQIKSVKKRIEQREWLLVETKPEQLRDDLRCAAVLWYASDWYPPGDFATTHVPLIERFVRDGGGLLVGGLGWSYAAYGPKRPYAADELGKPFGFKFTLDAFKADPNQPFLLLTQ